MKLVFFDIDGTLIASHKAKTHERFPQVIKKVFGLEVLINWAKHDGSIDRKIFLDTLHEYGVSRSEALQRMDEIIAESGKHLQGILTLDYKKRIIKEAVKLLRKLSRRKFCLGVLTGNFEPVGKLKLEFTNLAKYFKFGAFGSEAETRVELAKLALKKAEKIFRTKFDPKCVFVIGDTPNDVLAGKTIGANTIAVATGMFTTEQLKVVGADLVVSSLGDLSVSSFLME